LGRIGTVYRVTCKCHPEEGIRYVGQTIRTLPNRASNHKNDAKNPKSPRHHSHFCNWMRLHGLENIVFEAVEEVPESRLDDREVYWMARYRLEGHRLTNKAEGGAQPRGYTQSEETRKKISDALRGRKYGPLSEEHKRKMSESLKGHPVSQETREKLRKANTGKTLSEETRRKISEVQKGKKHRPETVEKRNRAVSLAWTPERRQEQSLRSRGENASNSVLTEDKVREMRKMRLDGNTYQAIADTFGVSRCTATRVIKRTAWAHVVD
jgi:group I intron endonuclease